MATPASTNGGSKAVVGAGWDGEAAAALEAGVGAGYQSLPQLSPPHVADGDGDSSSGGSKVRASLERLRWGEIVVLVVILLVSYVGLGHAWDRRQYLPKVTQVLPDGSAVVLANATMYSYPLRFDSGALECPPAVLDQCRFDATPKCCDFMRTGASPYQTITVPMLGVLAIIVPVLIILLRHALLRRSKAESSLRDVALGFLFTVTLTQAATNMVKSLVTQPRPNHYALVIYASLAPPGRAAEHYGSSAWHALPSGHCSLSMAGLLFVTLLLLADIQQHCPARLRHEWRGVLVMAACIPVFIALFIAASRIFDYFHSEAEATCGIVIGGFYALLGFLRVMPFGERPNKPLKWF